MAATVVADGVLTGILRLGDAGVAPPPTQRNRAVGGAIDVVVVNLHVLAEETYDGLHLAEVERDVANQVVRDIDMLAQPLDTRCIDGTLLTIADFVVLGVTHGHGITQAVVEEVAHHLRMGHIVGHIHGHGRTQVQEAVADDADARGILDLNRAVGNIDAVVFRGVPIAVGDVLHRQAQRLDAAKAVRTLDIDQIPGIVGEGEVLERYVFHVRRAARTLDANKTLGHRGDDLHVGRMLAMAHVVNRLLGAVEVELTRLIEQLEGVANEERTLELRLTGPCQRVQDGRVGLLQLDGNLLAPFLHVGSAENLLGPDVVLNQLHIFGVAIGHHLGTLLEADAFGGLTGTEGPRLVARNLDFAIAAECLHRFVHTGHAGAFATHDEGTELLVVFEGGLVEVALHLLPARNLDATAQDGLFALHRGELYALAVLAAQRLVNQKRLLQEVGTAMQAKLDILFLLFDRLAQCRYGFVEGLGRCLDNLLCLYARRPQQTAEQQSTQKELFFHGIVVFS